MIEEKVHSIRNLILTKCEFNQHGDIPPPRLSGKLANVHGKLYLYGGFGLPSGSAGSSDLVEDELYLMDTGRSAWRRCDTDGFSKPGPRAGHTFNALPLSHNIYLFGGVTKSHKGKCVASKLNQMGLRVNGPCFLSNSFYKLNVNDSTWQIEGQRDVVPPLCFHSADMFRIKDVNYMVIFGGITGPNQNDVSEEVYVYNFSTSNWFRAASGFVLPEPRFGHATCVLEDQEKLFMLGGSAEKDGMAVYFLALKDLAQEKIANWAKLGVRSALPESRRFHSVIPYRGSSMLLFGGKSLAEGCSQCLPLILDTALQRWVRPLFDGDVCLSFFAAAQLLDKLVVYGGEKYMPDTTSTVSCAKSWQTSKKLLFCSVLELKHPSPQHVSSNSYKIVTVGDAGTGKTSLLARFVTDMYSEMNLATIGAESSTLLTMVSGKLCTLNLWDTAGQERFHGLSGQYFRNANGFVVVFDVTRRESFERIQAWIDVMHNYHEVGDDCAILIIGNKIDMVEKAQVTLEEAQQAAKKFGATLVLTSAKTAENVDKAFLALAKSLVERKKPLLIPNCASLDAVSAPVSLTGDSSRSISLSSCSGYKCNPMG